MKNSLRPLLPRERDRIFEVADRKIIRGLDPNWCGRFVRFLYFTGMHLKTLVDPDGHELRVEYGRLQWIRAKNKKDMELPLAKEIAPWVEEFLAQDRPGTTTRLAQILTEIGKEAGVKTNFLRFRHSACLYLIREMGMSATDVERLMGISSITLVTYASRPMEDIEQELRAKGF